MDSRTIAQLEALERAARDAAERRTPAAAEIAYERLRSRAGRLNDIQQWASPGEFESLFPSLRSQRVIEALNEQYADELATEEPGTSVQRLLRHLAAWATGLLAAKELGHE